MSATPLILEDFTTFLPGNAMPPETPVDPASGFEDGYKAGWDDAVSANKDSHDRVAADLETSLQDIAFSFHEARAHILNGLAPLLRLMIEKVLPELAARGFPETVAALVMAEAEKAADRPLELMANPANADVLRAMLGEAPPVPVEVRENSAMGPGQAMLRGGREDQMIDMDAVLDGIRDAVEAFLAPETEIEEPRHA